jgi:hypothetical protein
MAHFVRTPEMESRKCPDWTPRTLNGHELGSGRVLNQSCSSRRELSNAMSHSSRRRQEKVDSRLLVVGSQTVNLTPGPSFAHNLGYKCPNGQCEAIFDIYVSRTFQWHQEHPNVRCFSPCCRALNIRESRRTPNLQLFQVLGFTPTLGHSGVATTFRQGTDQQKNLRKQHCSSMGVPCNRGHPQRGASCRIPESHPH